MLLKTNLLLLALLACFLPKGIAQKLQFNGRTTIVADSIVFITDAGIIYTPKTTGAAPREVGLSVSGLFEYGFLYKKQLREQYYLSLRTLALLATAREDKSGESIRINLIGGIEKRRPIADKLWLVHGPELTFQVQYNNNASDQLFAGAGPGYMLGAQFHFAEPCYLQFQVSAALQATYQYQGPINGQPARDLWGATAGFNTSNVGLSLVYQIF
ncbi:MAG: hypothetical protein JNK77_15580 [Saprospiraceae bacterium]|nr:hypothetical protein [Saprospiraceae bacterium]